MQNEKWLSDDYAQEIVCLLRQFILQANKGIAPSRKRVTKVVLPSLFDYVDLDKRQYNFELLKYLSEKNILEVDLDKFNEVRHLKITKYGISILRDWLNMPFISPQEAEWRKVVAESCHPFALEYGDRLIQLGYLGVYLSSELLLALSEIWMNIPSLIDSNIKLTWRQLSSKFFFGDSKFLDSYVRRDKLSGLFTEINSLIQTRAIQVSVNLASYPIAILFIENWDTYCWLSKNENVCLSYHLVYASGFKASANDIRKKESVAFYFSGDFSKNKGFESFWFSQEDTTLSTYFWGDLDYSGVEILKALKLQFSDIQAWQVGYAPMVKALRSGIGHRPASAGKENQRLVHTISCAYSENILLPALFETGLMLDQEWLTTLPSDVVNI